MKDFEARTHSNGEPISRLNPSEFHMYQAALERLGVPSEDAKKRAAECRVLYSPSSKTRAEIIKSITNGHTNQNSFRHEGQKLDTKIEEGIRAAIVAIGARPTKTPELQPVEITSLPTSGVIYQKRS